MYIVSNNKKINVIIANTFFKRLKGIMYKKNIDYILCFPRCNSIHTFFMKEDIDIIMINKNNLIVYYQKGVKRNKIIIKKEAYHTIELPHNSLNNIHIHDKLIIN